jgi:hypothetical protein
MPISFRTIADIDWEQIRRDFDASLERHLENERKKMTEKICSICQNVFTEYGNNAEPVNDGRCCNRCNWAIVIPARARMMERARIRMLDERKKSEQS